MIVYLMSHPPHCPYLVASLRALREQSQYAGEVRVYCWDEARTICEQIGEDSRLGVEVLGRTVDYRGKNAQFFDKIKLIQTLREIAIYLDADTLPLKPLDFLFTVCRGFEFGFVATQFNDWKTNAGVTKKRISRLLEWEFGAKSMVEDTMQFPYPSLNGGVFVSHPESPVLRLWQQVTDMVKGRLFIADEIVLNALQGDSELRDFFTVARGGKWNCSPKYQPAELPDDLVRIYHFHGDSCVRPTKSQKGYDIWWPHYKLCLEGNYGKIQDWKEEHGNKYIKLLEKGCNEE